MIAATLRDVLREKEPKPAKRLTPRAQRRLLNRRVRVTILIVGHVPEPAAAPMPPPPAPKPALALDPNTPHPYRHHRRIRL